MNKVIEYFDSIDNLPLYNFDRYRNTKDLNWFIQGYDGRQKKEDNKKLDEIEKKILDEYFEAINDRSFTIRMKKWGEIDVLKTKYFVVKSLLNRIWLGFGDKQMETRLFFIRELKAHGFKMPEINTLDGDKEEILRINSAVEGIKTKIAIIESELNKDAVKETQSLAKQIQIVTLGLQFPYRLNPKEITVIEWIELTKLLEEKSKQN